MVRELLSEKKEGCDCMFYSFSYEDVKIVMTRPLSRSLEEIARIAEASYLTVLPFFNGRIICARIHDHALSDKVMILLHPILYTEVGEYRKYLIIANNGETKLVNSLTGETYSFAIRLINESESPSLFILLINELFEDRKSSQEVMV